MLKESTIVRYCVLLASVALVVIRLEHAPAK